MKQRNTPHNSTYTQVGVSCFYESEVLDSSSELLIKFSAKNPHLRVAAKRCSTFEQKMNDFEQAYGKIEKNVVEKTNGLMDRLVEINKELKDLNIPIRVFSKTTDELNNFSKENQLYFKHTVNHVINFASDF